MHPFRQIYVVMYIYYHVIQKGMKFPVFKPSIFLFSLVFAFMIVCPVSAVWTTITSSPSATLHTTTYSSQMGTNEWGYAAYNYSSLYKFYANDTISWTTTGSGTFTGIKYNTSTTAFSWEVQDLNTTGHTFTYKFPATHVGSIMVLTDNTNSKNLNGGNEQAYFILLSGSSLQSSFYVNTTTGYAPQGVIFTDTSTGNPTSWYWEFGDGENSTSQNPSHVYNSSGTYNVNLKVSRTGESDWENKTAYITISSKEAPMCSFTVNQYSGQSPLNINFNDTSSGSPPLSQTWRFDMDDLPWIDVTPSETNFTSSSPVVTYSGSGIARVFHKVSNDVGESQCGIISLNISGVAPTPRPTPDVPFPNQTGICQNSQVNLGSQISKPYAGISEIITPDNRKYSDYFEAGQVRQMLGYVYTAQLGTYIYNEYNTSSQLEYRSSYVVEDCSVDLNTTTAATTIPTPYPTYVYPTVTGTIRPNQTIAPLPTPPSIQPYPTQLPIANRTNMTVIKDRLIRWSPLTEIYMDFVDHIVWQMNNVILVVIYAALAPIMSITSSGIFVMNLNYQLLQAFSSIFSFMAYCMDKVLFIMPIKVKNAITFCLTLDILAQIYNIKRGYWGR